MEMTSRVMKSMLSSFVFQVMCLCSFAGCGMVLAGNYLEYVVHVSLLIMVPPLIGLKGNIEMAFSSRMAAIANTCSEIQPKELRTLIFCNFLLSFILAVFGGTLAVLISLLLSVHSLGIQETFISFSVGIISSSFASVFIGIAMLFVIFLCKRISVDPDNVAPPMAAALGDFFVLLIMTSIVQIIDSVFHSVLPASLVMLCCLLVAVGPALTHLRENISDQCLSADYSTLTHCITPLLVAVCFSSASGQLLACYVDEIPSLARLQPPINGVGGNLASILISRMTTRLSTISSPVLTDNIEHWVSSMGILSCFQAPIEKDHDSDDVFRSVEGSDAQFSKNLKKERALSITEQSARRAIADSDLSARQLLGVCIPLHLILLVVNAVVAALLPQSGKRGATGFSCSVAFAYVSAGFIQIAVLLLFARWLVMRQWLRLARRSSPASVGIAGSLASLDLTAIALTTGLGDVLGTAILTLFLYMVESPATT